ncbi:hypothetical protein RHMOL_Rhmol13G0092100 [Rhododendron molle]|uniref:Uncharacterized protein n=1 Tax=Rhododendron molle TaxID=49168 RepID=A0ACC0L669_RHOML|nr:hypothetical protein RHMOL_Rhmol13G0092100 [Rhododendron molle]
MWRISITSLLRNLSTSSSTPNATNPTTSAPSAATKSKRKKKKNLFEDGRHGKAWGIAYKDEVPDLNSSILRSPAAPAKKISGVHKRCWRYIPNSKKIEEGASKPEVQSA